MSNRLSLLVAAFCCAGTAVLVAGGCAMAPAPPVETPPQPSAAPAPAYDERELQALLAAAERALAEDRLLTPEADSAYLYYNKALALAPDRADVRAGFERIVERYLVLVQAAIGRERWRHARTMLDRATVVDRAHPGIQPLRRQVELLANARRLTLDLDREAVRGRHPETAAKLAAFGLRARAAEARVAIRAGSDADGRWIYEQLNNAPGDRRIRGEIELGNPPKVTIVLLSSEQGEG